MNFKKITKTILMLTAFCLLFAHAAFAASDTLIVFYSWGGNTRFIAQEIQKQTGADIFEIQLEKPYSSDYDTVLKEAQRDLRAQARPKIKNSVGNFDSYKTIILGYPNWWSSIPMPIASFLDRYDTNGKKVVPFCSHGSGGLGRTEQSLRKLAPKAAIGSSLSVTGRGDGSLKNEIAQWLDANKVAR